VFWPSCHSRLHTYTHTASCPAATWLCSSRAPTHIVAFTQPPRSLLPYRIGLSSTVLNTLPYTCARAHTIPYTPLHANALSMHPHAQAETAQALRALHVWLRTRLFLFTFFSGFFWVIGILVSGWICCEDLYNVLFLFLGFCRVSLVPTQLPHTIFIHSTRSYTLPLLC
jgi:hypothetical protein